MDVGQSHKSWSGQRQGFIKTPGFENIHFNTGVFKTGFAVASGHSHSVKSCTGMRMVLVSLD